MPCVNSWSTTVESKAVCRFVDVTRPMFIVGLEPSTGVAHVSPSPTRRPSARVDGDNDTARPRLSCWKLPSCLAEPEQVADVVHVAAVVEVVGDLLVVARHVGGIEDYGLARGLVPASVGPASSRWAKTELPLTRFSPRPTDRGNPPTRSPGDRQAHAPASGPAGSRRALDTWLPSTR